MEKTCPYRRRPPGRRKHLHGRGEDADVWPKALSTIETPPRTWRRPRLVLPALDRGGNTSTDVEKTAMLATDPQRCLETPPRTWRRLRQNTQPRRTQGNTSTDVEKTTTIYSLSIPDWKHLHGRGEDGVHVTVTARAMETPPRTWRRLGSAHWLQPSSGNTSTDVEKTPTSARAQTSLWKHLHGRGEDVGTLS